MNFTKLKFIDAIFYLSSNGEELAKKNRETLLNFMDGCILLRSLCM